MFGLTSETMMSLAKQLKLYGLLCITAPLWPFQAKNVHESRKEGGLLFRAIKFLEKCVNKLLLFNFIVECKGKKLRTHSAEPLVEGLTFFQLSCPLFAVAAVCNGQLSSTICGVSIKELQNWLIKGQIKP